VPWVQRICNLPAEASAGRTRAIAISDKDKSTLIIDSRRKLAKSLKFDTPSSRNLVTVGKEPTQAVFPPRRLTPFHSVTIDQFRHGWS
jgi:hypothetical protein